MCWSRNVTAELVTCFQLNIKQSASSLVYFMFPDCMFLTTQMDLTKINKTDSKIHFNNRSTLAVRQRSREVGLTGANPKVTWLESIGLPGVHPPLGTWLKENNWPHPLFTCRVRETGELYFTGISEHNVQNSHINVYTISLPDLNWKKFTFSEFPRLMVREDTRHQIRISGIETGGLRLQVRHRYAGIDPPVSSFKYCNIEESVNKTLLLILLNKQSLDAVLKYICRALFIH